MCRADLKQLDGDGHDWAVDGGCDPPLVVENGKRRVKPSFAHVLRYLDQPSTGGQEEYTMAEPMLKRLHVTVDGTVRAEYEGHASEDKLPTMDDCVQAAKVAVVAEVKLGERARLNQLEHLGQRIDLVGEVQYYRVTSTGMSCVMIAIDVQSGRAPRNRRRTCACYTTYELCVLGRIHTRPPAHSEHVPGGADAS